MRVAPPATPKLSTARTVTFLIPSSWCKENIPEWVATGPYLGIRCLENEVVNILKDKESAPVTTTSLNLSGGGPIVSLEEALSFQENEANSAELIHFKDHKISGMSSTIIKVEENNTYEIIRNGTNTSKIRATLGLPAT